MDALDLITPDLRLRLLTQADRALYCALHTSPRVMARIAATMTPPDAARAFDAARSHNARARPGHRTWAVVESASGRGIGIGALLRDGAEVEAGVMLLPRAWNARWSAEVLQALIDCAFDRLNAEGVVGVCRAGPNERMARRLLAPHGFVAVAPVHPHTARWRLARAAARPCAAVGSAPRAE